MSESSSPKSDPKQSAGQAEERQPKARGNGHTNGHGGNGHGTIESRLNSLSLTYVERLYAAWRENPRSVPKDWRDYFQDFEEREGSAEDYRSGPSFRRSSIFQPAGIGHRNGGAAAAEPHAAEQSVEQVLLQHQVDRLVRAHRDRGHLIAQIDPLGRPRPPKPELEPGFYGITDEDMDSRISKTSMGGLREATMRNLFERLRSTYCRSIGVQYTHIDDSGLKEWLMDRMEATENRITLSREEQLRILTKLTDATVFEEFIQKKYLGAKSFSLEGAESLIPLLDMAIQKAGEQGIREIVMAMAHRGRLNVLANVMGKNPQRIFQEFEDAESEHKLGAGDVKYHLGYSNDYKTASGKTVHLSLCFNPSHLEYVNPVAIGRVRAKQDHINDAERSHVMALLIHGDAAFIGEGVVQETLNLSQLPPYATGGTLHVIVNNQIGFTTPPEQGRSGQYATAVAKMLKIPVFHVNGEDPEAVAQVLKLAMEFRSKFQRDVVIDMYAYRRRGHNEGDEPSFTQPLMYKQIRERKSVREGYLDHLLKLGGVSSGQADEIEQRSREHLEKELSLARTEPLKPLAHVPEGIWGGYHGGDIEPKAQGDTFIPVDRVRELLGMIAALPDNFHPHPKLKRFLEDRGAMARGEKPLDWSAAEAVAFGSLATEGYRIRMSGQDTERGTFSQRHSVLHDYETDDTFMALQHLDPNQAPVEIYNSPLSENGVLGFEYGYSLDSPDSLVLWEAQFGDFVNAAQVIVDQFIASAEDKWRRWSGIVMLLPHGFEGMGPEHSSARLERFLMLSADQNMQVVQPTTPAQYFHVLRRQMVGTLRKPLVVMTPKSLLRHPEVVSPLEEFEKQNFIPIIPDPQSHGRKINRIILCSGKIYYELKAKREELGRDDVAILRVEQLYPLPDEIISSALEPYEDKTPVFWVQDEPKNMGAWQYIRMRFGETMIGRFRLSGIYREESASPATGSHSAHKVEQARLMNEAFEK